MRKCSKCHEEKDESSFYSRSDGSLYRHCRSCHSKMRSSREYPVDPDQATKRCRMCGEEKPTGMFGRLKKSKDGLHSYCCTCFSEYTRARKFGLSVDQLRAMIQEADGICSICNRERDLVVDHCHATGKVRGMVCGSCNLVLGHAGDDLEVLRSCIDYLVRSGVE